MPELTFIASRDADEDEALDAYSRAVTSVAERLMERSCVSQSR